MQNFFKNKHETKFYIFYILFLFILELQIKTPDVSVNESDGQAKVCIELSNPLETTFSASYRTGDVNGGATSMLTFSLDLSYKF